MDPQWKPPQHKSKHNGKCKENNHYSGKCKENNNNFCATSLNVIEN